MFKLDCRAWMLVLVASLCITPTGLAAYEFEDPLNTPAPMRARTLVSAQTNAVAHVGARVVAVGAAGLIIVSDDGGNNWVQSPSPVSSNLTNVYFPTDKDGWVVGHDGVVLHTADGGDTWEKQLDGWQTEKILTAHFQALIDSGDPDAERYLADVQLNYTDGPEQALLSVWFEDARHGFVAGSFGTLLSTDDGGLTWQSWTEKVDGDTPLHYYDIVGTKMGVMIASERGNVYRLDEEQQRFVALNTGYNGTFFALLELEDAVLALGLRGHVYRLKEDGTSWEALATGVRNSITAGALLPDGAAILASQGGDLLITRDSGSSFEPVPLQRPMSFIDLVAISPEILVAAGLSGVRPISVR